jgi:D-alanyl-D-alanine dipeptidase
MRYVVICLFISYLHAVENTQHNLVNIQQVNPRIRVDLRYATAQNFIGTPVYDYGVLLVHQRVAEKLDAIQHELEQMGYGLLIWDAYRATREQQLIYEKACQLGGVALEHVSNPATSPGFKNRGFHIELTLVDSTGEPLAMPTDFDELNERTHSAYMDLPTHVLHNRVLLHDIMQRHGFVNFEKEWWYFRLNEPDWRNLFPRIELTLEEIKDLSLSKS